MGGEALNEVISNATTVPGLLRAITSTYGDSEAVIDARQRISYNDLEQSSSRLARQLLGLGIGKYARVGIHCPNSVDWVVTWFAIARCGAVAVPLSTFTTGPELVRILRHADCQALVVRKSASRPHPLALIAGEIPELGVAAATGWLRPHLPFLRFAIDLGAEPSGAAQTSGALDAAEASVDDELLKAAEDEVHASDPATMIYTSGTTSAPKGVVHSHDAVLTQVKWLAADLSFDTRTRNYTTMPFFWVGGLAMSLLPTLASGGVQITTETPDPAEILTVLENERADRAFVYPPQALARVLAHPAFGRHDLRSIRRGVPGLVPEFTSQTSYSGTRDGLQMGLGMSETFGPYWWGAPDVEDRATPPLDRLSPGWDMKVLKPDGTEATEGEQGEICIRGPHLALGLQKRDRATTFDRDGYYRTGDIGKISGERVRFRGRASDTLKVNGANVSTAEVIEAIAKLNGVSAVYVAGLPHAIRGAEVAVAVVPNGSVRLEREDVLHQARRELASYKVPTVVAFLAEGDVPLTPTGKVDQRGLVALLDATRREESALLSSASSETTSLTGSTL